MALDMRRDGRKINHSSGIPVPHHSGCVVKKDSPLMARTPRFAPWSRLALMAASGMLAVSAPIAAQQFGSPGYRLLEAVKKSELNDFETLINQQPNLINTREILSGNTPLLTTVERRDVQWTNLMLVRGADANLGNNQGIRPLIRAVQLGWQPGVTILLARGARVNDSANDGQTALHYAVLRRDIALVRALIAAGANPDATDNVTGKTPRDIARDDGRSAAILAALDERPTNAAGPQAAGPAGPH